MEVNLQIHRMEDLDLHKKKVLLRLDINSPIDPKTKKITNDNRLIKSLPTLRYLLSKKAAVAIIAHQGDTLDYHNLISLEEHAQYLTHFLETEVRYIDDVAGPTACEQVGMLQPGQIVILGNLRYLTEEVSTFEDDVPLKPRQMLRTYLVRRLAPLFDVYVNDAFSAAHRNAPSMVAFQQLLPGAAGILFFEEISALTKVMKDPARPSVFLLGGAKISDAFSMMEQVLKNGNADTILTCGVTGLVMLIAQGYELGETVRTFLVERSLDVFIDRAKNYWHQFSDRLFAPLDLAYEHEGFRKEELRDKLPEDVLFFDIGKETVRAYNAVLNTAGTIFVNGPAGMFEHAMWEYGTKKLWQSISHCKGYTVIGGGDTVNAAAKFVKNKSKIDYACTAGGAMVRFLSGKPLPLIQAMQNTYKKKM